MQGLLTMFDKYFSMTNITKKKEKMKERIIESKKESK